MASLAPVRDPAVGGGRVDGGSDSPPVSCFPFHLATMRLAPRAPLRDPAPRRWLPFGATRTAHGGDSDRPVALDELRVLSSAVERTDTNVFILSDAQVCGLPTLEEAAPWPDTTFAVLYGPDNRLRTWLRAGEAFAAGCLATVNLGVSIRPLTDAIENTGTRENIRRLLPGPGHPYLIMQVGPRTTVRAE